MPDPRDIPLPAPWPAQRSSLAETLKPYIDTVAEGRVS